MTLWLHLSQRIADLEAENFTLAAGQCVVENGLVGDEHGHFGCTLVREREQVIAWLRWQAESAAEDASIPKAVWWALNFAASTIERGDHVLAQGMSTGTAKTPKAVEGRSPASPVAESDAPMPCSPTSITDRDGVEAENKRQDKACDICGELNCIASHDFARAASDTTEGEAT